MKSKAESIWKHLDDLQKRDPAEYRKFVNGTINEGREVIKEEKKKEVEEKGVQSEAFVCAKLKVVELTGAAQKDMDIKLFEFQSDSEINPAGESKKKYLDKPEVYLNIVHSSKVMGPLKKDRTAASVSDDKSWFFIPISFQLEVMTQDELIIYNAHLNTDLVNKAKTDKRILNSVFNLVLRKFQAKIIHILRFDHLYVEFIQQKFKAPGGKTQPDLHILSPDADPKRQAEIR